MNQRSPTTAPSLTELLAVTALVGTVALGASLRWVFAGQPLVWGQFEFVRHAHTHLAYYGVLFPLMWVAWRQAGAPSPGKWLVGAYTLAVAGSVTGFALEGYGLPSIVGSTAVLAVWLWSAWRIRRQRGWLALAAPFIVAGACTIPLVAVASGRAPELAPGLVRGFLTLLLLGAIAPSALAALGVPPPRRAGLWAWAAGTLASALALGPVPLPVFGVGLVAVGGLLGVRLARATAVPMDQRLAWGTVAAALVGLGVGVVPAGAQILIGGFHFLALGPLLVALTWRLWPRPPALAWRVGHLAAVGVMSGAVVVQHWGATAWGVQVAAWSGAGVAVWMVVAGGVLAWRRG